MTDRFDTEEFFIDGPVTDADKEMIVGLTDVIVANSEVTWQAQYGLHALDSSLLMFTEEVEGKGISLSLDLATDQNLILELSFGTDGSFYSSFESFYGLDDTVEKIGCALDDLRYLADRTLSDQEQSVLQYLRDFAAFKIAKETGWDHNPVLHDDKKATQVITDIVKNEPDIILKEQSRRFEYRDHTAVVISSQNYLGLPEDDWLQTPHVKISHEDEDEDTTAMLTIARGGKVYYDPPEEAYLAELAEVFGEEYIAGIVAQTDDSEHDPFTRQRAMKYIELLRRIARGVMAMN